VAGDGRSADEIQTDIVKSRAALAETVDQLAFRASPKRVLDNARQALREKAATTEGKIVIGAAGGLLVLLIVRRIRKH
jgi:hypothetical protein